MDLRLPDSRSVTTQFPEPSWLSARRWKPPTRPAPDSREVEQFILAILSETAIPVNVDHDSCREPRFSRVKPWRVPRRRYKHLDAALFISGELKLAPMNRNEATSFLLLVSYHYGRGSILVTTNMDCPALRAAEVERVTALLQPPLYHGKALNTRDRSHGHPTSIRTSDGGDRTNPMERQQSGTPEIAPSTRMAKNSERWPLEFTPRVRQRNFV